MRTTLDLNENLFEEAKELSGIKTKTEIVHAGLRALIEKKSRQRLATLKGKVREASAPCRRRAPSAGK